MPNSPDMAHEALAEVMAWIANWSPSFTEDDEWEATEQKALAALASARTLAAERDALLTALQPFAMAHKKLELMPGVVTRYSFHKSELVAARVAVAAACGVEWEAATQN